jgi:two-component system CheB/CheR fusion protein
MTEQAKIEHIEIRDPFDVFVGYGRRINPNIFGWVSGHDERSRCEMASSPRQKPPPNSLPSLQFPVIAIGASAGGLEALTSILSALPAGIPLALVLIQHLDPKRHSLLAELLSKATTIPVLEATDAMAVESNHVYVMPSNVNISLKDGKFALTPRVEGGKQYLPIDTFMTSLATERKGQSIGIILSGTASDGTAGVEAIRAAGGVTFAQAPESAKFDGMPRSAIGSGCVDFILPPERIADEIIWISGHPGSRRAAVTSPEPVNEDLAAFDSILSLVSTLQGANFREYKPNTIRRRTHQRMASLRMASLAEYRSYLEEHPEEIANLSQHILVGVTEFFRNPEVFEDLSRTVFPAIAGEKQKQVVRIWVVACSSGEEVYSLGISLLEFLGKEASGIRIQIFGTDINEKAIAKARAAIYTEAALRNVSEKRISQFFTKVTGGYQVNKTLRELCIFARQDVTKDPPFSNIDLISCRNFLIYVQPHLQMKIISTLHYALNPSGFLLLGNAESAASYPQIFTAVDKAVKIYSKRVSDHQQQRTFRTNREETLAGALPALGSSPIIRANQNEEELRESADRIVLEDYAPVGVVVNEALEILQFRGKTSPYMEQASGRANLNLLNMVHEDLAIVLRTAIASARKKAAPVKKRNVVFEHNGRQRRVHLSVIPMARVESGTGQCYLILFEDVVPIPVSKELKSSDLPAKTTDAVRRSLLEQKRELRAAHALLREHLATQETLRESYQVANEELLSANEELQSTNEELETSKEELESTNEELTTVNDELNSSNFSLQMLGNDLKNLLESTVIPIVMVDRDMCIRRLTPMAEKVFKVLPSDIGRPITDFRPDFDLDLKPLLTTVLRDLVNLEREVQDHLGHWYRLQIRTYKTLDSRIDGAVLVLTDIDAMKKHNQALILAGELTESIIETMPQPVLVLTAELRILMANRAFYCAFEVEQEATVKQSIFRLGNGQWDKPALRVLLDDVLPNHKDFRNHEVEFDFPGVGWKSFVLSGRYMVQEPDAAPLILLSFTDTTQRKKTEAALIQSEKLAIASRLAASVAHEINNPLEAITNLLFLTSNCDIGTEAKEYITQAIQEVRRVAHITQQTLRFHRQSVAPSSVQVSEILESLLVLFHGKLAANRIVVDRQFKGDPPIVCLAGDLRQIFANILANAIDAMPSEGTLTLRVRKSSDWRNPDNPGVRITIADSGTGMNLETRRKIYEPFFTTKRDTGTGLGMWVSAQIVDRMQADLRVWSTTRRGKSGTAFSLFLPMEVPK